MGQDSTFNTETHYTLADLEIKSQWGWDFFAPIQIDPGPSNLLYKYQVSFLGVKHPGHGTEHPPHPVQILRKEYSYTSTPLLGLHGLL